MTKKNTDKKATSSVTKVKDNKKEDKLKDQQELGKAVQMFLESGYYTKNRLFVFSFLKGVATGVGTVIGATVVIAVLLWILSFFSEIPFVNNFTDKVQTQLEQRQ